MHYHLPTPAARVLDVLCHLSHDIKSAHTVRPAVSVSEELGLSPLTFSMMDTLFPLVVVCGFEL